MSAPRTPRPSRDDWFSDMATLVSHRSTCARRSVGCVLVNARGQVLATGYNGVARGLPHCIDGGAARCAGADAPTGVALEACEAIHAEQNALLQCHDVEAIRWAYVTVSPCITCVKLLLNTGCQTIVFKEPYAHDAVSRALWVAAGREWRQA